MFAMLADMIPHLVNDVAMVLLYLLHQGKQSG